MRGQGQLRVLYHEDENTTRIADEHSTHSTLTENTHRITPTSKVLSSQHHRCAHEHALLLHNTPSHEAHPSQRIAIVWTPMFLFVAQSTINHGEVPLHPLHTALVLLSPITYRAVQNPVFPPIAEHTHSPNLTCLDYDGEITALHSRIKNTRFSSQAPAITIPSFSFNRILHLHSVVISIHSKPTKNDTTPQRDSTPLPRRLYNSYNT